MFDTSERIPRNQLPSPIMISDIAGRIEWRMTLAANSHVQPWGRFMAEPPPMGSTGQR